MSGSYTLQRYTMTRMTFKEDVTTEMMRMAGIEEIEDLQIEDIVADR
jgi:hypothetical protein